MRHTKSRLVKDANESAPVRFPLAPTGPDKSGSKPWGERVYLFLESTINDSTPLMILVDNRHGVQYNLELTNRNVR